MSTGAPYHRAHQLYHGGWAVVHSLPGQGALPPGQRAVAVDVDGFIDRSSAEREATRLNAELLRDAVRWANTAGLCGVRL